MRSRARNTFQLDQQVGVDRPDAERAARALELRKGGATYEMIGQDLGVSTVRAFQIVNEALKALVAEPAAEVRKLEVNASTTC